MRTWLTVLAVAAMGLGMGSGAVALPTAAEVIDRMVARIGKISSLEVDANWTETVNKTEHRFHYAIEVRVEDDKAVRRYSVTEKMTIPLEDGRTETVESRITCDGIWVWIETRGPGDTGVRVRKERPAYDFPYLGMAREMKSQAGEMNWQVQEASIGNQRAFILEGHNNVEPPGTIPVNVARKVWVGQDDLLIHRIDFLPLRSRPGVQPDTTSVTVFTNLKVNQKVDPGLFKYMPPEGAKVVEEGQP